jgi:hypothetical protein
VLALRGNCQRAESLTSHPAWLPGSGTTAAANNTSAIPEVVVAWNRRLLRVRVRHLLEMIDLGSSHQVVVYVFLCARGMVSSASESFISHMTTNLRMTCLSTEMHLTCPSRSRRFCLGSPVWARSCGDRMIGLMGVMEMDSTDAHGKTSDISAVLPGVRRNASSGPWTGEQLYLTNHVCLCILFCLKSSHNSYFLFDCKYWNPDSAQAVQREPQFLLQPPRRTNH